jgi:acetyl esterase
VNSRIVLDAGTRDWVARVESLSSRLGLGAESDAVDPAAVAAERALRQRLSDEAFAEFGAAGDHAVEIRDHLVAVDGGEIRVRQYRPVGATEVLPGYLLLHGGAFWLGSIDESINRELSAQRVIGARVTLFDVDYRLAPEHPFPTALEDAFAALRWMHEHSAELGLDPAQIIVGGVSAGGNLAAALGQLARDRGGPTIAGQILEVPAIDLRSTTEWPADYAEANGIGDVGELLDLYAGGASANDPYVSPAAGSLAGLPPTHIMTAEYDPLGAAAETYATDLRAAGVEVSATRHLGMLHGSAGITARVRGARLWHAEVVSVLRELTGR